MNFDQEDTINKTALLNWLHFADKELSITELSRWIEAKTSGKYIVAKRENVLIPDIQTKHSHDL